MPGARTRGPSTNSGSRTAWLARISSRRWQTVRRGCPSRALAGLHSVSSLRTADRWRLERWRAHGQWVFGIVDAGSLFIGNPLLRNLIDRVCDSMPRVSLSAADTWSVPARERPCAPSAHAAALRRPGDDQVDDQIAVPSPGWVKAATPPAHGRWTGDWQRTGAACGPGKMNSPAAIERSVDLCRLAARCAQLFDVEARPTRCFEDHMLAPNDLPSGFFDLRRHIVGNHDRAMLVGVD